MRTHQCYVYEHKSWELQTKVTCYSAPNSFDCPSSMGSGQFQKGSQKPTIAIMHIKVDITIVHTISNSAYTGYQ